MGSTAVYVLTYRTWILHTKYISDLPTVCVCKYIWETYINTRFSIMLWLAWFSNCDTLFLSYNTCFVNKLLLLFIKSDELYSSRVKSDEFCSSGVTNYVNWEWQNMFIESDKLCSSRVKSYVHQEQWIMFIESGELWSLQVINNYLTRWILTISKWIKSTLS